jgi:hypothetical protein
MMTDLGTWATVKTTYAVDLAYHTTYAAGEGPFGHDDFAITNT